MVLIGIDPYLYLISLNISRFGNPSTGKHDAQVLEKGNGKPDQSGLKSS
jgi:hypothetical protein